MVDYIIGSKDCSSETIPKAPIGAFPYTFSEPIPIIVDVSFSYSNGSHKDFYLNGYITGYANSVMYPALMIVQQNGYGDGQGGFIFHKGSLIYQDNTRAHVTVYDDNGTKTEDFYTTGSYDATMLYGGNIPNAVVHVNRCTIPVIFETNRSGEGYAYQSRFNSLVGVIPAWEDLANTQDIDFDYVPNAADEVVPETTEYEFTTIARKYTMDNLGNKTELDDPEIYRGFRIKSRNKVSIYKVEGIDNGILKYKINFSDASSCYYSNDYGNTWLQVPGQPTTLPFDFTYRPSEGEIGTYYCAVGSGSNDNLLIFDNEADSNEYNSGNSDGRKASNYDEIMNKDFDNPTGEEDEETEFGEVKTRGFFSQQYIMDSSALQALADDLFDTSVGGIWEAIKKGLDMYGDNPIEAVMGLSFWPLNLTSVFSGTAPANYIWFGGYGWDTSGHGSVSKITYPNGYKTLGSLTIKRTFRNWRDWSPYTRLYASLPYCGVYELDLTRYYDKTVEVRYFFDTRTNGCIACLIADGHLMDYFNGQMGVTMPITLTDYAGYANSQIATLLGAGALAAGVAGGMAMGVVGLGGAAAGLAGTAIGTSGVAGAAAAAGASLNAAGAATIIGAGAPVAGAALGAKTVYGLSQNNINKHNVTKGGSSSMINEYLPQYVEFIFEIQEDCAPDNYGSQYGYPSMKSGSVGSFQGFLKCQSVKLDCGVATENEKNQIKTMLLNGIYI